MDASTLRSEISSLRSECNQLERENSQMRGEINAIINSAAAAANSVGRSAANANAVLTKSNNVIEYSNQVLEEVTAEQENISFLYRGFKNIETANKKIRELNNKIYFEFANFRMVRKIVRAFVDNFNLDIVNPERIYKAVEKEHLQSPDFWLSCAMLAIMHWKDDDASAANRALKKAMELDDRQTTLFFMSFNLILGRKDAALKWFEYYCKTEKTGNDASIILLLLHATNIRENDGDAFTKRIKEYLFEEFEKSKELNDWDEMVDFVKGHLVQFNTSENFVFDNMRNYVKDYSRMSNMLSLAKDNQAILDFVETTNCATRDKGFVYVEKFINELLDTPDKKERAYTDEIAYNEMIIKCTGDLGAAEQAFKAQHEYEVAPLNLMYECVNWLFGTSAVECSAVAKSNMFVLCRELIEQATEKYYKEYRALKTNTHPVEVREYNTNMDFNNKTVEEQKAKKFYNDKLNAQLATVKNTPVVLCIIFAALCFIGGIVAMICKNSLGAGATVLMVFCMLGAIVLAIMAVVKSISNKKKKEMIKQNIERLLQNLLAVITKLFDENAEFLRLYDEFDRVTEQIDYAIKR